MQFVEYTFMIEEFDKADVMLSWTKLRYQKVSLIIYSMIQVKTGNGC